MRKSIKPLASLHPARAQQASTMTQSRPITTSQKSDPAPTDPCPPAAASTSCDPIFDVVYKDSRQNKKGSCDGSILVSTTSMLVTLRDDDDKTLCARSFKRAEEISPGAEMSIGKWHIAVGDRRGVSGGLGSELACPIRSSGMARPAAPIAQPAASTAHSSNAPPSLGAISSWVAPSQPSMSHAAAADIILDPGDANGRAPVLLDRQIGRLLRPWQVDGLRFMYGCLSGRVLSASGEVLNGCILAHAPGLGKTLTAIALIFTLLKGPLVRKAVVVCPASLVRNWQAEVRKFVPQRLKPTVLPAGGGAASEAVVREFARCPPQKLLLLSYEAARAHVAVLRGAGIGLLIADEGHKLKAAHGNQTIDALRAICRTRRVILTGTPLQNDLTELWALCDFVCSGALGDRGAFASAIAAPIDAGLQPSASARDAERAEAARVRLREWTKPFMHRRDAHVLNALLPPRTEIAIFPRLSNAQASAYMGVVAHGVPEQPLAAIQRLRSICSHAPMHADADADADAGACACACAKVMVLMKLLEAVRAAGQQVVVCSGYKRGLDVLEAALQARGWGALRVDGDTPVGKRQELVNRFNATGCRELAFLLTTRAGGVGFNLVGASRLVLLDPDWNPAVDEQAMGRVYRQGQTRPVQIWRFFHAGTLEEKIFQRQLTKKRLDALVDGASACGATACGGSSVGGVSGRSLGGSSLTGGGDDELKAASFTKEELRQIFEYDASGRCLTLAQLLGRSQRDKEAAMGEADTWVRELTDPLLREALSADEELRGAIAFACDRGALDALDARSGERSRGQELEEGDRVSQRGRSRRRDDEGMPMGSHGRERCEEEYEFKDALPVHDRAGERDDESESADVDAVEARMGGVSELEIESNDEEPAAPKRPKRRVSVSSDEEDVN